MTTTTDFTPTAIIAFDEAFKEYEVTVHLLAAGVDRTQTAAWSVKDLKTAQRLVRAIEAGSVLHSHEILTDINGKTYVSSKSQVLGRLMNANLTALGF